MGKLWRDPALGWRVLLILGAGLGLLPLLFWIDPMAGVIATALYGGTLLAFGTYIHRRQEQIAALSDQLARISRGDYAVEIREYKEGELSILSSEILKITSALSHRAQQLGRDKVFLADTLADISHQLKTPLTSMSMLADLLEDPALPSGRRQEFLGGIRTSLDRMEWLIASLLKLSRLDAGTASFQMETAPLDRVVEAAVAPLRVAAERKEQVLDVESQPGILVETDSRWLGEAVGNLIKNCIEHTPCGGRVSIRCTQNPLYTEITVADSGPGIGEKDLPRIFERFYRGENAAPDSVGIGLALSKSILLHLGGTLSAGNRAGGGAEFCIKLYGKTAV